MQALTIRLPDNLHQDLRTQAFMNHTTINALILEALEKREDA